MSEAIAEVILTYSPEVEAARAQRRAELATIRAAHAFYAALAGGAS